MNKPGDVLEVALWYNADRPGELERAQEGIYKVFYSTEQQHGFVTSPVTFIIMHVGDDRVPEPPDVFSGTPRLLVGEVVIERIFGVVVEEEAGFAADLEPDDLNRLRQLTQNAYLMRWPHGTAPLTDEQLDTIINEVGPDTAARTLSTGTDQRSTH